MSKAFTKSLLLYNKVIVRRLKSLIVHAQPPPAAGERDPHRRSAARPLDELWQPEATEGSGGAVAVCEVEGGLLMSPSTFPYFMLVALEAGGLLRGLVLLLLYPVLRLLRHDRALKVMVMVSFLGLRKDRFRLGRAAMPKLFLQDVSAEVFRAAAMEAPPPPPQRRRRRCVCVSAMPRAMIEPSLTDYLGVDAVVAPELKELRGYYLGIVEDEGEVLRRLDMEKVIGADGGGGGDGAVVGIGGIGSSFRQIFQKYCKEVYVATEPARRRRGPLHPRRYPKPLVFHDGRTAFRPTPAATLAMFVWLPLGAPLAVLRTVAFLLLPFSLSVPLLAAFGMHSRVVSSPPPAVDLFACNHRSLLDPLYVSASAGRAGLAAATYSISRLSEMLSPIPTFRLTRDRAADRAAMQAQLVSGGGGGGLVVCPEGTTCREPFLLRFSPLFAELGGGDVGPVALHSDVGMFHGTTAGGRKLLDPLYLLMNPMPSYIVQFLDPVRCGAGGDAGAEAARGVANEVQRRIAEALGYTCTGLTRRDKYLMLAGNEGVVVDDDQDAKKKRSHQPWPPCMSGSSIN